MTAAGRARRRAGGVGPVVALGALALVASACSGYTGSAAHRVSQWVQAVDLSTTDGLIRADLVGIANGRRLHELHATRTECAGLADDASTAETNLPTPDRRLTADLNSGYLLYGQAGAACGGVSSFAAAGFRHYDADVSGANASLRAATQRLAALGLR